MRQNYLWNFFQIFISRMHPHDPKSLSKAKHEQLYIPICKSQHGAGIKRREGSMIRMASSQKLIPSSSSKCQQWSSGLDILIPLIRTSSYIVPKSKASFHGSPVLATSLPLLQALSPFYMSLHLRHPAHCNSWSPCCYFIPPALSCASPSFAYPESF